MLLLVLLILIIPSVFAVQSGTEHNIFTTPKCYGDVGILIAPDIDMVEGELELLDCSFIGNLTWNCPCNDQATTITFKTLNITENNYDFILEYYLLQEDSFKEGYDKDNDKRIKNFNNIKVSIKDDPFIWNSNPLLVMVIIIVVIVIVLGTIYKLMRYWLSLVNLHDIEAKKESKGEDFDKDNEYLSDETKELLKKI